MIREIVEQAASAAYDFRDTANPCDPLAHLFPEWVGYYRLKWAISRVLQPRRILEIGVRFGYSAAAFLDASPEAEYLGIDNDSDTFGGQRGGIEWARRITARFRASYLVADSQALEALPGGSYDLVHIDGQQDGAGSIRDLETAIRHARHILLDGYLWTRENFLHVSEFLYRYRDAIETWAVIPGYAGELLIAPGPAARSARRGTHSQAIKEAYTSAYYLSDCGGYDAFKRDQGRGLSDRRLQTVATVAETAPVGRAVDLGCGRGELSIHLARLGHEVLAIDYSESALALARTAAESAGRLTGSIAFQCGDVTDAPLSGEYDVAVASDLIEHLSPVELDRLYARIAAHLPERGVFVVHTFPNLWHYKYAHPRARRQAGKLGAYVPLEPRTRFEALMHINEQSPAVLRRQLRAYFPHVFLWFADHSLEAPFENVRRPFSVDEMRQAGDLFALASRSPIDVGRLRETVMMAPLSTRLDVSLEVLECPETVTAGSRFQARVRLTNRSTATINSGQPNPIHLSYHWLGDTQQLVVFDGLRTRLPALRPDVTREVVMSLEAPRQDGPLLLRTTLVQEGVRWFDEPSEHVFVDRRIRIV